MIAKIIVFMLAIATGINGQSSKPCPENGIDCIRNYFGTYTSCNLKTFRSLPKEASVQNVRFSAAYFNTTHIDQYVNTRNIDQCKIVEFTVNTTTQVTVITVECTNLRIESNRAFDIGGDKFYIVRVVAEYDTVRLTQITHGASALDYCRSKVYWWTTVPTLFLQGRDRASVEFVRTDELGFFGENLPIWLSFIWETRAPSMIAFILRSLICEFNCPVCYGFY